MKYHNQKNQKKNTFTFFSQIRFIVDMFAILTLVFMFSNCNFFTSPDRGTSPFLKSLLSIVSLDRTPTTIVSVLPKDKSTGNYLNTNVFIVFNRVVEKFAVSSSDSRELQVFKVFVLLALLDCRSN